MKITDKTFFKSSFPFDLDFVNTVTKYPSIPTYHEMDGGRIQNKLSISLPAGDEILYPTEKIDGTNARIILFRDKLFIGSREELLFASGDVLYSHALDIVDTLADFASRIFVNKETIFDYMNSLFNKELRCVVFYGEVYGGKIGKNAKNYACNDNGNIPTSFRLFDVGVLSDSAYGSLVGETPSNISIWREKGNQYFLPYYGAKYPFRMFPDCVLNHFSNVPVNQGISSSDMPVMIEDTYSWLKKECMYTHACINNDILDNHKSEGIVLRNQNHKFIVKIRHEDYERKLKIRSH